VKVMSRFLKAVICAVLGLLLGFALTVATLRDSSNARADGCPIEGSCCESDEGLPDGCKCSNDPCTIGAGRIVRPANLP